MGNPLSIFRSIQLFLILSLLSLSWSCNEDDFSLKHITILSSELNGIQLVESQSVDPGLSVLTLVFNTAVDENLLLERLHIQPAPASIDLSLSNQSTKADINLNLLPDTEYTISIPNGSLTTTGLSLESSFATHIKVGQDHSTQETACLSSSSICLHSLSIASGSEAAVVQAYTSFSLFDEGMTWPLVESAILVIHGQNRDADNYYHYLSNLNLINSQSDRTALVAPLFKDASSASADELYWSTDSWRSGGQSGGTIGVSSFSIIDSIISRFANPELFPAMKNIIITGHSSGALLTLLYAGVNSFEEINPNIEFTYIPANSQYYYYPDGQRIDESTDMLYTPTSCAGYQIYPTGYEVVPPYLQSITAQSFTDKWIQSRIIYLLGNGQGADPALNTVDCQATLLGSSRYRRGANMYRYLTLAYPSIHQHEKIDVEGIGHDGEGMYASPACRSLLESLLR